MQYDKENSDIDENVCCYGNKFVTCDFGYDDPIRVKTNYKSFDNKLTKKISYEKMILIFLFGFLLYITKFY